MNKIINIFVVILILLIFVAPNVDAATTFTTDQAQSVAIAPIGNTTMIVVFQYMTRMERKMWVQ